MLESWLPAERGIFKVLVGAGGGPKLCHLRILQQLTESTPMATVLHPLLMLLAQATEKELVRHIEYLKGENQILQAFWSF